MKKLMAVLAVVIAGCATDPLERFQKVQTNMDKDSVLDLVGDPVRTEKSSNKEKWFYRYYSGDDKQIESLKYIQFVNGRVTSFGEDAEELKRLQSLKDSALKKEALRKQKAEVEEKVEKAMNEQKAQKPNSEEEGE